MPIKISVHSNMKTLSMEDPASSHFSHESEATAERMNFWTVKEDGMTDFWRPLEAGRLIMAKPVAHELRMVVRDPLGRIHAKAEIPLGANCISFVPRGAPGWQTVELFTLDRITPVATGRFRLVAETSFCSYNPALDGLYQKLAERLREAPARAPIKLEGRSHAVEIGWSRDHAYTLKSTRYFRKDTTSGVELWLKTQRADGSFWDCFHSNPSGSANWFCEALGEGWFDYYEKGTLMARRIPVEADVEYCIAEAVFHAWQASGDSAWAGRWVPGLERALAHTTSHPLRWSERHGLVKRSFCMDSWDFAHPAYCAGDKRCIHPGDPAFLFHGDNSGLYQFHMQLAVLQESLGNPTRARELRNGAAALRARANSRLYFERHYGHMIPEELPEEEVFQRVGNEWQRMSLSTGYTINRGLPDHAMAVAILDEYRCRYKAKRSESWAEWWTMDPPYTRAQWPEGGPAPGDYMNGGICLIVAGELAKAGFDHGRESYAADILLRVAGLAESEGENLTGVYRRLSEETLEASAETFPIDIRTSANRGLKFGAFCGVPAWTEEGDNDMRNLPVGDQVFGGIGFHVIDPSSNNGRAVLHLDGRAPAERIPIPNHAAKAASLAFLHVTTEALPDATPTAVYRLLYSDGTSFPVQIRSGREIAHWWGAVPEMIAPVSRYDAQERTTLGWQGPNPIWKTTGLFVFRAENPFKEKSLVGIEIDPSPLQSSPGSGMILCGVTALGEVTTPGSRRRSGGLPACWALSSVFHGLLNGLAGIEDLSRAFERVRIAPRFSILDTKEAKVCLHYPASDAYCCYAWRWDSDLGVVRLDLAGSFQFADVHLLLPAGYRALNVLHGQTHIPFAVIQVEQSAYLDFQIEGVPTDQIVVQLTKG